MLTDTHISYSDCWWILYSVMLCVLSFWLCGDCYDPRWLRAAVSEQVTDYWIVVDQCSLLMDQAVDFTQLFWLSFTLVVNRDSLVSPARAYSQICCLKKSHGCVRAIKHNYLEFSLTIHQRRCIRQYIQALRKIILLSFHHLMTACTSDTSYTRLCCALQMFNVSTCMCCVYCVHL